MLTAGTKALAVVTGAAPALDAGGDAVDAEFVGQVITHPSCNRRARSRRSTSTSPAHCSHTPEAPSRWRSWTDCSACHFCCGPPPLRFCMAGGSVCHFGAWSPGSWLQARRPGRVSVARRRRGAYSADAGVLSGSGVAVRHPRGRSLFHRYRLVAPLALRWGEYLIWHILYGNFLRCGLRVLIGCTEQRTPPINMVARNGRVNSRCWVAGQARRYSSSTAPCGRSSSATSSVGSTLVSSRLQTRYWLPSLIGVTRRSPGSASAGVSAAQRTRRRTPTHVRNASVMNPDGSRQAPTR
jgi:hypothetical protein